MESDSISKWAKLSTLFGLLGFCILPVIGPLLGIVFAIMGILEVKRSGGERLGNGTAVLGLLLSLAALVGAGIAAVVILMAVN